MLAFAQLERAFRGFGIVPTSTGLLAGVKRWFRQTKRRPELKFQAPLRYLNEMGCR